MDFPRCREIRRKLVRVDDKILQARRAQMILAIDTLGKIIKDRSYYDKEEILDIMNALRLELWIIDNELDRRDELWKRIEEMDTGKKPPKLEEEEEEESKE